MSFNIYYDIPYALKDQLLTKDVKKSMLWDKERKKWKLNNITADVSSLESYKMQYIEVPYDNKDEAKSIGAKFDGVVKKWYYTGDNYEPFNKFSKLIVV